LAALLLDKPLFLRLIFHWGDQLRENYFTILLYLFKHSLFAAPIKMLDVVMEHHVSEQPSQMEVIKQFSNEREEQPLKKSLSLTVEPEAQKLPHQQVISTLFSTPLDASEV